MTGIETETEVAAPSETLVEVEFKGARREFYLWTGEPLARNVPARMVSGRFSSLGIGDRSPMVTAHQATRRAR